MSSKSIETRTQQKDKAEAALKTVSEKLSAAGLIGKDLEKAAALRAAKAKLKKAKQRLAAYEDFKAHVQKEKEEKLKADSQPEEKNVEKPKKGEAKEKSKGEAKEKTKGEAKEKSKKPKKEAE